VEIFREMKIWKDIIKEIESRVDPFTFETWFKPLVYVGKVGNVLYVRAPNPSFKKMFRENFPDIFELILKDVLQKNYQVKIFHEEEGEEVTKKQDRKNITLMLNPKYTFENFVVASSNQFAYSAALAVAKSPSSSYNPLFIYGGVGLGKTHLLNAIGHFIIKSRPELIVVYTTTEKFMNEMVAYLRNDKIIDFKEKYRKVDVLLIDDIQFLSGKEQTKIQLFHLFNTLYDSQKQIVLSSDRPPKDIEGLEDRILSRFEWGLIADIQPPELETRIAILLKKAELENFDLPGDVAEYIAMKIKSNVRQLEGALIRLKALATLKKEPITIQLAKEALRTITDVLEEGLPSITVDSIVERVGEVFNVEPEKIKSKTNVRSITLPRQVAMYLSKKILNLPLKEIGNYFGGKHHTTVLHSINKVEELIEKDSILKRKIDEIEGFFR